MKEPSKTSGGLLYRMTVEFGGSGVGGDKDAKFREYKDLDSGGLPEQLHPDAREAGQCLSPRRGGGGVARSDQHSRLDLGRIQHVESARLLQRNTPCLHVDLQVAVGRGRQRRAHAERTSPGGTTDANTTQANMLLAISSAPAADPS